MKKDLTAQKKKEVRKKEEKPAKQEKEKDERFDFGGLPDINLKKNLGCG